MLIFKRKPNKGFTLVEVIIYVFLFSIIMTSLVSFGLLLSSLNAKNLLLREANANARNAFNFISSELQNSKDILSPIAGTSSSTVVYLDSDLEQKKISLKNGILYLFFQDNIFSITRDNILFSNLLFKNLSIDNSADSIQFSFDYSSQSTSTKEFYYEHSLRSAVTRRF